MKSVDEMSDQELDALMASSQSAAPKKSVDNMSDDELNSLLSQSSNSNPEKQGYGPTETYLKNALDTATLDHGPNLISAVKNLSVSSPDYIKERDNQRSMLEAGKENNPVARYSGAVTGALAPAAAMLFAPEAAVPAVLADTAEAANVTKAAVPSILKATGKNLLINEGLTGLQNPGDVKGQASGLQLKERLANMTDPTNVAINTVMAGGAGALENKLGKMAVNKDALAYKALQPSLSDTKNAFSISSDEITPDRASKIGSLIKNQGILEGSPDVTEIAKRAKDKLAGIGEKIGSILENNDKKVKYSTERGPLESYKPEDLANALGQKYEGDSDLISNVTDKVDQMINDRIKNKGDNLSLSDLQKIRANIQSKVNYNRLFTSDLDQTKNEMMADAAKYFNGLIEKEISKNSGVLGEDAAKQLKVTNQQYNLMSDAVKISHKAAAKAEQADTTQNMLQSILPSIGIGGVTGLYSHSPGLALGAGLATAGTQAASHALLPRANAMAANLAASPMAQSLPAKINALTRFGGAGIGSNYELPPPPPPTPYEVDQQIKHDPQMSPSQKAKARLQNNKMSK